MAQRLEENFNTKTKSLERVVLALIVVLFLLLAKKYLFDGLNRPNYFSRINNNLDTLIEEKSIEEIRAKNIAYNKIKNNRINQKIIKARLTKEDGGWKLSGADGYFLDQQKEKILIKKKDDAKPFSVLFSKIGEYYSVAGQSKLDIPTQGNYFRVYEQEDLLPILGYHYVVDDNEEIKEEEKFLKIHISDFDGQIAYATNVLGCRWFTFGDLMKNYILLNKKLPTRSCAINFDDGHRDGYEKIFPVLKKHGAVATYYIITDMLGKPAYMNLAQVGELYRSGNEIGSHTLFGGSIVRTDWFEKKFGRPFDHDELVRQIRDSKQKLNSWGYEVTTFAYPLGEWNDEIIQIIKDNGYVAARDTSRDYLTTDKRAIAVSYDENYIWHMNYLKPELFGQEEFKNTVEYNTWWQFEDGYKIVKDVNNNIRELSSLGELSKNTYHVVDLQDRGDRVSNRFIIKTDGKYKIELYGSTGWLNKWQYSYLNKINVFIDNKKKRLKPGKKIECKLAGNNYYCYYYLSLDLTSGLHSIDVESNNNNLLRLDKFRIFREFATNKEYVLEIRE